MKKKKSSSLFNNINNINCINLIFFYFFFICLSEYYSMLYFLKYFICELVSMEYINHIDVIWMLMVFRIIFILILFLSGYSSSSSILCFSNLSLLLFSIYLSCLVSISCSILSYLTYSPFQDQLITLL